MSQLKQIWMTVFASMIVAPICALPAAAAEPDDTGTAVLLARANLAASQDNWADAADFLEQAFATIGAEPSEEQCAWLTQAGEDWTRAGNLQRAYVVYKHAQDVAGASGFFSILVSVEGKLSDTLLTNDDPERAFPFRQRAERMGELLAAAPQARTGSIKCEDSGTAIICSQLHGGEATTRLLLPDPVLGSLSHYMLLEPNGKRSTVKKKVAIDWMIKAAATGQP